MSLAELVDLRTARKILSVLPLPLATLAQRYKSWSPFCAESEAEPVRTISPSNKTNQCGDAEKFLFRESECNQYSEMIRFFSSRTSSQVRDLLLIDSACIERWLVLFPVFSGGTWS
jgi:hypothetical protein